jgi:hypothetical protein
VANDKPDDKLNNPDYLYTSSGDAKEWSALEAHFSNADESNFVRSHKISDRSENGPGTPGSYDHTVLTFQVADNNNLLVKEAGLHVVTSKDLEVSVNPFRLLEVNPTTGTVTVLNDNSTFYSRPLESKPQVINIHQEVGDVTGNLTGVVLNQF